MPKAIVQHVTEGNELYWDEASVGETTLDEDGVYKGKPRKGTPEGLEKARGRTAG